MDGESNIEKIIHIANRLKNLRICVKSVFPTLL